MHTHTQACMQAHMHTHTHNGRLIAKNLIMTIQMNLVANPECGEGNTNLSK